jgi:KEOPS complex subunit Cgi121
MIAVGARGTLDIAKTLARARQDGTTVQILNARRVCGLEHLEVAYERAQRAFAERRNVAETIEMEFLRYASGERQICDAVAFMGAITEGPHVFVFFDAEWEEAQAFVENLGLALDDDVVASSDEKVAAFLGYDAAFEKNISFYGDLIFEKITLVELMA